MKSFSTNFKQVLIALLLFAGTAHAQAPKLWGTTYYGGRAEGTIFSFDMSDSLVANTFQLQTATGIYASTTLFLASDGKFYGTTEEGGANNAGVLFQYNPLTHAYVDKIDFVDSTGGYSYGSLMQATDGKMYGTQYEGGAHGEGVLFQYDPVGNTYIDKVDLNDSTGEYPYYNALVQAGDGKLYCLTPNGGAYGTGTIFQYDPVADTLIKKVDMRGDPYGSLLLANDGKLYGTASDSGANNSGFIFKYNPGQDSIIKLFDMVDSTGAAPNSNLIQGLDGKLYGTTSGGGLTNKGVIYKYDLTDNIYTKLFDFSDSLGSSPYSGLLQASDSNFYGLTYAGGANHGGVLFQFNLKDSTYSKLLDLNDSTGTNPQGSLIQYPAAIHAGIAPLAAKISLQAYPNPAHDKLNVIITGSDASTSVLKLMDVTGRQLMNQVNKLQAGTNTLSIDLGSYAKGLYILSVDTKTSATQIKVVVE